MLKTFKVLSSMLSLREFTVESLQNHSGINPQTVRTVLLRKETLLDKIGFEPKGQPGGRPIRYRLKPQAETTLRDEIGKVFEGVRSLPDAKLGVTEPLKAPLALLAAEHALLKRFPNAVDSTEKQELLKIVEQNISSGNLELKAIASSVPEKADAVRALMQSVKVLVALSQAELNVESGRTEDAFRSFPAIYQESSEVSNALYSSGESGRAGAFCERVWTSPLIKPLIENIVHGLSAGLKSRDIKLPAQAYAAGRNRSYNINAGFDPSRQTIALLPLTGKEGSQTYIYDGITRGIWSRVCELPDLTVVNPSRVSASPMRMQDSHFVQDLGRRLNVQNVLFGSVSVNGSQLSCKAQLLSVESGLALWQ